MVFGLLASMDAEILLINKFIVPLTKDFKPEVIELKILTDLGASIPVAISKSTLDSPPQWTS